MKRLCILASSAIVALADCTKTDVVYTEAPEEIALKAVTGAMTKAPVTTVQEAGDMVVYATLSETVDGTYAEYFSDIPFTYTTYWGGTPAQYWPNTGYMKFWGYAPNTFGDKNGNATTGVTIDGIDISTTQTDVLYSLPGTPQNCATPTPVPMTFNHALAQICVEAKVSADAMKNVQVTGLEVVKPNLTGTLTIAPVESVWKAVWSGESASSSNLPMTVSHAADLTTTAANLGTGLLVVPGAQQDLMVTYEVSGTETTKVVDLTGTWEMGKKYVYTLSIGLNEITVNPSVTSWDNEVVPSGPLTPADLI